MEDGQAVMEDCFVIGPRNDDGTETRSGLFWLAEARAVAVPGQLTLGDEGPRLRLDGTLTPGMKVVEVVTGADGSTLTRLVSDGPDG
jgi:hypothetical protein